MSSAHRRGVAGAWRGTRSRAVRGQLGKLEIKVVNSRYWPIRLCPLDSVDRPRVLGGNPTGGSSTRDLVALCGASNYQNGM
jgi:hypothetical protein